VPAISGAAAVGVNPPGQPANVQRSATSDDPSAAPGEWDFRLLSLGVGRRTLVLSSGRSFLCER
jgi:hypothetical protein